MFDSLEKSKNKNKIFNVYLSILKNAKNMMSLIRSVALLGGSLFRPAVNNTALAKRLKIV